MTSNHLIEMSVALRMSSCSPRPWFIRFNDSQRMKELSGNIALCSELAQACGLGIPLEIKENCAPAEAAMAAGELAKRGEFPRVIIWKNNGIFTSAPEADETVLAAQCLGEKTVFSHAKKRAGRLAGCVAVVTGSAQGFGRGIAEALAGEGAAVVVSDLNETLGRECADKLDKEFGRGAAIFAPTDVTSLESIVSLVELSSRSFGGIDIFIANAGVLKSGALHEFDEKSFDFVTNVNYKAFFLCVKAVAPLMKLQHTCNSSYFADIIQINSKSGLQGSNKNFAYAGSKFGSIGLVQSFAMELVEHNIKVNAICPGNFFEGPLWMDPEKGLFVQYLRAGKVPGAKTIEDVKKSYTDKVPMKRGCFPSDVARAILYIRDQLYETGQAVPVTGGQVMLN